MSSPAKNEERKPPILAIGLMSGTSLDGIDASIVYTDGEEIIDLGASTQLPMPNNLKVNCLIYLKSVKTTSPLQANVLTSN